MPISDMTPRLGPVSSCAWMAVASLAIAASANASAHPAAVSEVPVHIGGEPGLDACGSQGRIAKLRRGQFLAVRSGPGIRYRLIDRLGSGRELWLCELRSDWYGVVYSTSGEDCGVSSEQAKRVIYRGPCRAGWVSAHYVLLTAG